eukprot:scaffold55481_cov32-Phaeocystis_antarctica.AAC.4
MWDGHRWRMSAPGASSSPDQGGRGRMVDSRWVVPKLVWRNLGVAKPGWPIGGWPSAGGPASEDFLVTAGRVA